MPKSEWNTSSKNNIIKTSPLSPLGGKAALGYERYIAWPLSIEIYGGLNWSPAFPWNTNRLPGGGNFLKGDFRFYLLPPVKSKMNGFYLGISLFRSMLFYENKEYKKIGYGGSQGQNPPVYKITIDEKQIHSAIIFTPGIQFFPGERWTLDLSIGLGYGGVQKYDASNSDPVYYSDYDENPSTNRNALLFYYLEEPKFRNKKVVSLSVTTGFSF
ncbi:MAG: hypothetical protein ACOZCO_12900 [Bacteroidota bacterium]